MDLPDLTVKTFFTLYGPLGLGWPMAFMLWLEVKTLQRLTREHIKEWLTKSIEATHASTNAVTSNTNVLKTVSLQIVELRDIARDCRKIVER